MQTLLQNELEPIRQWAHERGLIEQGNVKTQLLKLTEEVGELSKAILKNNSAEYIDALGDIVIVLTNMAAMSGLNLEDCVNSAYDEIKNRKGQMVNNTFMKYDDF